MRNAVVDPITGAIPAIHRAVVQAQGIEFRRLALVHHPQGIFLGFRGEDDSEAGDILLKDLGHAFPQPTVSEVNPGPQPAGLMRFRTGINRMLKYGNTALMPQAFAEQKG